MKLTNSFRFALLAGSLVSVSIALVVTLWEWLENPGGIFRGPEGTRWSFVLETAWSWLLPTLLYATLIALCCHLLVSWIRRCAINRQRKRQRSPSDD